MICVDIKEHLLHHQNKPVVIENMIGNWESFKWTPDSLKSYFPKSMKMMIKKGSKSCKDIQWENDCNFIDLSYEEFYNEIQNTDQSEEWVYLDYKHMKDLFSENTEILDCVDWSPFGFKERNGYHSTLWIGSTGAHTPCHYDTYGCNLVAQIYGSKKWILFPPQDEDYLYPRRIPYEESSVFSDVMISNPDLLKHPKFKHSTAYVVTLNPGQVLFVPHHWWHYVECLETSISINTWIEMDVDIDIRLEEAITRTLIMSLMKKENQDEWLNPTEEVSETSRNLELIEQTLKISRSHEKLMNSNDVSKNCKNLSNTSKKIKLDINQSPTGNDIIMNNDVSCLKRLILSNSFVVEINSVKLFNSHANVSPSHRKRNMDQNEIINVLTQPKLIRFASSLLNDYC